MVSINPYLNFNGNCKEAFNFYKEVFGGEFTYYSTFEKMPEDPNCPITEEDKDKIMHVSLPIGSTTLMGSDFTSNGPKFEKGNDFGVAIDVSSEEEADKLFNKLADGGEITMPIAKTFWNAYFGMCIDKFGIQWMINYDYEN